MATTKFEKPMGTEVETIKGQISELSDNKADFVSLGTFTATTFTDFLKAVCASYYSNSEENKAVNFVATWSGNDYYTGLIRKRGNNAICMTFVGNDIASCSYNASNQSISVNDISSKIENKAENKIGTITTGSNKKEKILLLLNELNTYIGNITKNLVFSYGFTGLGVATGTCGKNREVIGNILYFEFTLDSKLYSGYYISSSDYRINEHTGTTI